MVFARHGILSGDGSTLRYNEDLTLTTEIMLLLCFLLLTMCNIYNKKVGKREIRGRKEE